MDCQDNFGADIKAAPCNCYGLKQCICCCNPCYESCSVPIVKGIKNPDQFLVQLKKATDAYHTNVGIPVDERVVYASVSDNFMAFGAEKGIEGQEMSRP